MPPSVCVPCGTTLCCGSDRATAVLTTELCPQLQKNILKAYSCETYFGGNGYSVLNTNLREEKEDPAMAPAAQLLHHAVSDLAASDEYGFDGMALRAMSLPPNAISQ